MKFTIALVFSAPSYCIHFYVAYGLDSRESPMNLEQYPSLHFWLIQSTPGESFYTIGCLNLGLGLRNLSKFLWIARADQSVLLSVKTAKCESVI